MRSTLLVTTAALLAGIGLASAQGTQSGGQSGAAPSAQSQGGAAGQERQSPQSSPSQRSGQAQQEPMQKGTTGQAPQREQGAAGKAGQEEKAQPQRSGQGQRDQQSPTQAQSPQRQENQQGQSGQAAQGQSQGSKTLTTEGPRATNVNFSVSVGTTVPTSVRVVAVPSTLIEIYPEWRGHMYFIVNDEIIIVDSRHRIIAVLPV
jgi:DNA polymerase III gamma/tau subunit